MGLSDGRKSFPIGLAVLLQYRSVTASQPASQPASHVAVAITLNAQASSLKSTADYTNTTVDLPPYCYLNEYNECFMQVEFCLDRHVLASPYFVQASEYGGCSFTSVSYVFFT